MKRTGQEDKLPYRVDYPLSEQGVGAWKSVWTTGVYPDSLNLEACWVNMPVSFSKVKLINKLNRGCQIILNSLHKHKLQIHIVWVESLHRMIISHCIPPRLIASLWWLIRTRRPQLPKLNATHLPRLDSMQRETGTTKIRGKNLETRCNLCILSGRAYFWNQPFCLLPTHALSWEVLSHTPPHMAMALSSETTVHSLPPSAQTLIGTPNSPG